MSAALLERRSIADVLEEARARLTRLTPPEALDAQRAGAVVVDIRPAAQRLAEGGPDGVLVVERNVLEWRFDPTSEARLPLASYDLQVVVLCQEGYTSSLAAAALQDLGIHRATDVIGGWAAWRTWLSNRPTKGGLRRRTVPTKEGLVRRTIRSRALALSTPFGREATVQTPA